MVTIIGTSCLDTKRGAWSASFFNDKVSGWRLMFILTNIFEMLKSRILSSDKFIILKSELHPQLKVTHWNPGQVQPIGAIPAQLD